MLFQFRVLEVITACRLSWKAVLYTVQTIKFKIQSDYTTPEINIHDQKPNPSASPQCSLVSSESTQQSKCISRVSSSCPDEVSGNAGLITVTGYIIIDPMDDDSSATEALLGAGTRRGKGRRREDLEGGGDRTSGWEALKACLGLSQCLTNIILCTGQ
jgi:hypothetical protein